MDLSYFTKEKNCPLSDLVHNIFESSPDFLKN